MWTPIERVNMRVSGLTLLTGVLILAGIGSNVHAEETLQQAKSRIERQRMQDTSPNDAFRYLSGHLPNFHNHPAIYAAGVGLDAKLYVVGNGVRKVYPLNMRKYAFEAYEELLQATGYLGN